ncbi:MAG TPA: pitrilysin family protein, partial [Polyangia bacterium]|nr:pitrilysin family protein [Polyangia bacterium]
MSAAEPVDPVLPESPPQMRQAPQVGPFPALVTPTPITFRLSNGVEVMAVRRQAAPIVAMNLILRTGADRDPAGKAGLASLTAEMMDEGAGERSALEITEALERLGADLWVGTGRDGAQATVQVPTHAFDGVLAIASDVIMRPRFAEADWERVHHDRVTALQQRGDHPESVADLVTSLTLYGAGHPYGRPVDGFEKDVAGIQRADAQRFYETYWRPNNAVVTVAGDFDPATLPGLLEKAFGSWQAAPLPEGPTTPSLPALPRLVLVNRPEAPQSVLRMIGPGSSRLAPDR